MLDLERNFVDRYNHELIDISRIHPEAMQSHVQHLEGLLGRHTEETGSAWGQEILGDLRTFLPKFWVVKPKAASVDSLVMSHSGSGRPPRRDHVAFSARRRSRKVRSSKASTSAFTTPPIRVAMPPASTQNASSPRSIAAAAFTNRSRTSAAFDGP